MRTLALVRTFAFCWLVLCGGADSADRVPGFLADAPQEQVLPWAGLSPALRASASDM